MALYHLHVKNISRADGKSAIAAAAYRSGERLWNVREDRFTDFTNRGAIVHTEILAPAEAPDWMRDREELWNGVEAVERRKDARLAKEVECALPRELPHARQIELARQLAGNFVDLGLVVDLAVHDEGKDNPHAHILLTTRKIVNNAFGGKLRALDNKAFITKVRKDWAAIANTAYAAAGLDVRIDHRTLEAQGIDRTPQTHRGPDKPGRRRRRNRSAQDRRPAGDNHRSPKQRTSREETRMTREYDELIGIQKQLDQLETESRPQEKKDELTATRHRLLEQIDRREIEIGRGLPGELQKRLLVAWDTQNLPVPDKDNRPVRPGSQDAASEREQTAAYFRRIAHPRDERDGAGLRRDDDGQPVRSWDDLSPAERRDEIQRRTRLDELKAEIREVRSEIDKVDRARFMSEDTRIARRTELMRKQIELEQEETRIALRGKPVADRPTSSPQQDRDDRTEQDDRAERDDGPDQDDQR